MFKEGDRVRVAPDARWADGTPCIVAGKEGTVKYERDSDGDYRVDVGHEYDYAHERYLSPVEEEEEEEEESRPGYYGGADNPYEAIKVIEAWDLNFSLGNVVKYVARAGKKDSATRVEDLRKAANYIQFEIARLTREES